MQESSFAVDHRRVLSRLLLAGGVVLLLLAASLFVMLFFGLYLNVSRPAFTWLSGALQLAELAVGAALCAVLFLMDRPERWFAAGAWALRVAAGLAGGRVSGFVEGALGYGTRAEGWYVVLTIALAAIQVVAMFALLACVLAAYDRTRRRLHA